MARVAQITLVMRSLWMLVVLCGVAGAEPLQYALTVNNPLGWVPSLSGDHPSVGVSGYVGVADMIALRGNVASYNATTRLDMGECPVEGRITDVGLSAQFYPSMRRFDGFFLEAGGLVRDNPDGSWWCEYASPIERSQTSSTTYGGIAMVGYTLTGGHFFLSGAVGASLGVETGKEATATDVTVMLPAATDVSRQKAGAEWYLRIGAVW